MARPYQQSGYFALKRRLLPAGFDGLDHRSSLYQDAMAWQKALEEDLGGTLTATRAVILRNATVKNVLLQASAEWVLAQLQHHGPLAIVNSKRRQAYPLLREIAQLSESIDRAMVHLGLDRPTAPVLDLATYLEAKHAKRAKRGKKAKKSVATVSVPGADRGPHATAEPADAGGDIDVPGAPVAVPGDEA